MILNDICMGIYIYTSFGHLATLEASRGGGNTARGIYLLVGYTLLARGQA